MPQNNQPGGVYDSFGGLHLYWQEVYLKGSFTVFTGFVIYSYKSFSQNSNNCSNSTFIANHECSIPNKGIISVLVLHYNVKTC